MSTSRDEETVEELARLASLARRAAAFLGAAAGAYTFFAYGMGIIGSVIVLAALAALAGVESSWVPVVGVIVGAVFSTLAVVFVAGPVWRYLASQGFQEFDSDSSRTWLSFGVGFSAVYAVSPIAPRWYPGVAWYPGLALSLALLYIVFRRGGVEVKPLLLAAALLAATSPLVLWAEASNATGNALASGLVLLVYLAAGTYAMRAAAKRILEG